jgi:hypothetical protein
MNGFGTRRRVAGAPALRLVHAADAVQAEWAWFCGHCAAPAPGGQPPSPAARVCGSCGFGLLLETRGDALPSERDAFLVVDGAMLIQGLSRKAEQLLAVGEELAVNRPVSELLVAADAEARGRTSFAEAVVEAAGGNGEAVHAFVRPWNTFGVRLRARIAPCGPPRAALVVLDPSPARPLRAVPRPTG